MRHDPEHAEPGLVHPEVAAALGRLAELAATRQPDEGVLPEFLERYYRELPEPDLDDRRLDELYSVAVAHFAIGRRRQPGETLVRVISPDTGLDGRAHHARSCSWSPTTHRSSSTRRASCSSGTVSTSTCWCTRCSTSPATTTAC